MHIKRVELKNFRNYDFASVNLGKGFNLISGTNGQGKTNLAESMLYASLAKSPRTHHDEELVQDGAASAFVCVEIEKQYGSVKIEYSLGEQKTISINGNPIKKLSDLFARL